MLVNTRGIVFHSVKYSETSIITKIYTKDFGLESFLVNGIHSKKSSAKAPFFQPLNVLELQIYQRKNKNLQRIRELNMSYVYRSIPFNVYKSSIALFLLEVLNKVIKEHECNEELYAFIEDALIELDEMVQFEPSFHLHFLIALTRHLGISPAENMDEINCYFDLRESQFAPVEPVHPFFMKPALSKLFNEFIGGKTPVGLTFSDRTDLLEMLLKYYDLHLLGFAKIKSREVLRSVLSEE